MWIVLTNPILPIVAHFCACYPNFKPKRPKMGEVVGCGLVMFLSTVEGSIDGRGRVLVPSSFRTALEGASRFFLYPIAEGGGCLEGGGMDLMQSYRKIFSNLHPNDVNRRANVMAIFSNGSEITMDQAGRANIPANLLREAGIEKELLFVGAMDRFQIWNPERFASYRQDMSSHATQNPDALAVPFYQSLGQDGQGGA